MCIRDSLYTESIENNRYVEKAVITGVSHIAGTRLSRRSSVATYRFLDNHQLFNFYGFQKREVNRLFAKFKVSKETKAAAFSWYKGYTSKRGVRVYCPFSILSFLQNKTVTSYWRESGQADILDNALRIPNIKYLSLIHI